MKLFVEFRVVFFWNAGSSSSFLAPRKPKRLDFLDGYLRIPMVTSLWTTNILIAAGKCSCLNMYYWIQTDDFDWDVFFYHPEKTVWQINHEIWKKNSFQKIWRRKILLPKQQAHTVPFLFFPCIHPRKTNMETENDGFPKGISLPPSFSKGSMFRFRINVVKAGLVRACFLLLESWEWN